MSNTIVDVCDLRKVYRGWSLGSFMRRPNRIEAVRGVSLQASAGEVFGILGPNGAGKTTLIKMLLGVVKPSGGSASLFGLPVGDSMARRRVGYLPESLRVDKHHTARTALRYYGRMSRMSGSEITKRSDELLEMVGLRGRDKESVRRFSKGMYQRLGLAQALMHDPDLLVLDEPTDGLDPVGRNEVRQLIEHLSQLGKTIFLNSHILQEVELVCSRVAILAKGKVQAMGPIDELADRDRTAVIIRVHRTNLDREAASGGQKDAPFDELIKKHVPSEQQSRTGVESIDDGWQLRLPLSEQGDIDAVVDQIRAMGYAISYLETLRPSLEETFIRLVDQASETDDNLSEPIVDAGKQS